MNFIYALRNHLTQPTTSDLQTELQLLVPVQKQRDDGNHHQQAQILHYFINKTPLLLMHNQISKGNSFSPIYFLSPIKITASFSLQVLVLP